MTFTQLEIFVTVVESQSFSVAASRLAISQSGVSHAIASLEAELGVALIERHHQGVALTEMGRSLLAHAREIRRREAIILQEAAATKGLKYGTVRIGSFGVSASVQLLPDLISAFGKKYPDIELHVFEERHREVIKWLHEGYVDIGFVTLPCDTMDTIQIAEDRSVAVLPENHPLARQSSVSLAALAAEPFILSMGRSEHLSEEVWRTMGIHLNIRYRFQQVQAIFEMVRRGLGVSIVAELALPEDRKGLLVIPLEPADVRRIGLAVRNVSNLSLASRAFFDFVQEQYSPDAWH